MADVLRNELDKNSTIQYGGDLDESEQELVRKIMSAYNDLDVKRMGSYDEYGKYTSGKDVEGEKQREQEIKDWRRQELLVKQEDFNKNIAKVYNEQYDVEFNCRLLDELVDKKGEPMCFLKNKFVADGSDWQGWLEMRAVIMRLPSKYRKKFDLAEIEAQINRIDGTILNDARGMVTVEEIKEAI